ncbi:MAG TPA: hypothetical protein VNK25_00535 [Candidatus Nitrosotenuis sp.]|nr:hypothetical protein [Candidatus Nitrosotenuis sp.]
MSQGTIFVCKCNRPKRHRLTFDGGSSGNYDLELCEPCYEQQDKKFLISESVI